MKIKRKFLTASFLCSLGLLSACIISVLNLNGSIFLLNAVNKEFYTLNLTSSNKPTLFNGNGSINVNGENVEYVNAKDYSLGHVSLNKDGYICKENTLGLKSIKVDFDGNPNAILLQTGDSSANYNFEYYLEDNISKDIDGNSFKIVALEEVDIASIQIIYQCNESTTHIHEVDNTKWYQSKTTHYHICKNENCISRLDESFHNEVTIPEVAPTTSTVGYTAYKKCSICDYVIEEAKTIPLLSSADYNITYSTSGSGRTYTESTTYTLKDTSILGEKVYSTSVAASAFILINGVGYGPETLKQTYPGMEMSLSGSTITLNIIEENGVTIDGNISALKNLKITGYPLTLNTNNSSDAIKLNVYYDTISDLFIENNTSVVGVGTGTASGFVSKNITVNENAKLSISGYQRSTWLCGGSLTIYGDIDFTASISAFSGDAGSTLSTSRWIFKDGVEVSNVTISNAGTHLEVVGFDDINHEHSNIKFSVSTSPTKDSVGAIEGKCSLNHLIETIELPKLNRNDYSTTYTSKLISDDKVQDVERYTWNETKYGTFYFDIGGDVFGEYIKAGSSIYSLNRWNEIFTNQSASVNNKILTISLNGNTTVTASDGVSPLDGTLDLTKYDSVIINGNGKLNISYSSNQDGLNSKALTIGENAEVYLSGYNKSGSGFKVETLLNVSGLFDIAGFANAQYVDGNKTVVETINEGGKINFHDCNTGLNGWSTSKLTVHNGGEFDFDTLINVHSNTGAFDFYTDENGVTNIKNITGDNTINLNSNSNWYFNGITNIENVSGKGVSVSANKTLNINGQLNLKTITKEGFNVAANLTLNVNAGGSISIDGVSEQGFDVSGMLKLFVKGSFIMKNMSKNGFWFRTLCNLNIIEVTGSGIFDITTNNYGIYHGGESTTSWSDGKKTFDINVRDQATFNIYSKVNTIYGFNNFVIAQSDYSKCDASVSLRNKTGDSVQNAKLNNNTNFLLNSSKEMFIYTDSTEHSGTGLNFVSSTGYDNAGTTVYKIYTDLTIRNFYCAIGGSTRKWGDTSVYIAYTMLVQNCTIKTANWNSVVPCCTGDPVNLVTTFRNDAKYSSDSWTVLLYMCGNDLESDGGHATTDLREIEDNIELSESVNIVVQAGGAKSWSRYSNVIKADKCNRFHIEDGLFKLDSQTDQVNMGLESSLTDFITWGTANYPAEKIALILWDHGNGIDGCCFDENYTSHDGLNSNEIANSISTGFARTGYPNKLEFLAFDCCMQQIQDSCGAYYPYAKYVVASEETVWTDGFSYDIWLKTLCNKASTEAICKSICNSLINAADKEWPKSHRYTLSSINLSNWKTYESAWEDFASYLKNDIILTNNDWTTFTGVVNQAHQYGGDPYYDLYDVVDFLSKLKQSSYKTNATLMEKVSTIESAFNNLNIYSRAGHSESHGLAFYCPIMNRCHYTKERTCLPTWWSLCKKFVPNCE